MVLPTLIINFHLKVVRKTELEKRGTRNLNYLVEQLLARLSCNMLKLLRMIWCLGQHLVDRAFIKSGIKSQVHVSMILLKGV